MPVPAPPSNPVRPLKILLVSQFFDPEPIAKGLPFARELRRRGHDVQVLTGFPNYPGGAIYPGWRQRPRHRSTIDGITVTRVPLYPSHDGSGLRRALNYLSFTASAAIGALTVTRPDVVYTYNQPAGVVGLVLKHLRGVPYVVDVQDLWPDTVASSGMMRNRLVMRLIRLMADGVVAGAAHVVTLAPGMTRVVAERSGRPEAVSTIVNWALADDGADADAALAADGALTAARPQRTPGRFVATFAGNLGIAQRLDTVLDAAALLRDDPGIVIRLVGDGVEADHLRRRVATEQLTNVELTGRVPLAEAGRLQHESDALLVHLADDPLYSVTIPSKTQACLLSGRPVVMAVRGDAADLVRRAGAGPVVEPGDAVALAEALRGLADLEPAGRDALGRAGRRFYDDELSLGRGVDRFEVVLRDAAATRSATLRREVVSV